MRVSSYFELGRTQPTLDFLDIDVTGDTPVFISPRALTLLGSPWGERCVSLIQDFFQRVLHHIQRGENEEARALLSALREPNETHLGLSKGLARGRALGTGSAREVWKALSESEAARSGLLEDLEDTVLLVDGISVDIISDITTNIIRAPLIEYTQHVADMYGIPLSEGVSSGPMWDPQEKEWSAGYVRLPMTSSGKILLVPKAIVRKHLEYEPDEYFRHYLLEHLRQIELNANSSLVELLKNKNRRVTKKALIEKFGSGKSVIVRETLKHPEVLAQYKKAKEDRDPIPLTHEELAAVEGSVQPDWDELLRSVTAIPTGQKDAVAYENAIEALLSALFYPDLTNPRLQREIHDGRKRIDITYTNMALGGFFSWVAKHHPAASIFVECKNYGKEMANPEIDQLSSRFSPSRGRVGLLVCRGFENKALFLRRCRDTAMDGRGFVIVLDDADLAALVESRKTEPLYSAWRLIHDRFDDLVN